MKFTIVCLAIVLAALVPAVKASAGFGGQHGGASSTDVGGIVEATNLLATAWGGTGSSGREGGVPCFASVADANVARQLVTDPSVVHDGEQWVAVTCYSDATNNVSWLAAVYRIGDPAGVDLLVEQAKDYLVVPEPIPALRPGPATPHLVGIPEYLAVDDDTWRPWSATAAIPGMSVTLVADPVESRWDLGNGDAVTCSGPGTPWQAGLSPADACTYTYQWSSTATRPDGVYHVSATTLWTRTWTCTPACGDGTLPLLSRSTTFDLTVEQGQAVITRTERV
jgi:hypothetical protein